MTMKNLLYIQNKHIKLIILAILYQIIIISFNLCSSKVILCLLQIYRIGWLGMPQKVKLNLIKIKNKIEKKRKMKILSSKQIFLRFFQKERLK